MPGLAHTAITRSAVLAQLSARPSALDGDDMEAELISFTATSTFNPLVIDLAAAPMQEGPAAPTTPKVTIGWGRHDRLCFPSQARRAKAAFPGASLRWFDHSGHYLIWDEPARARARLSGRESGSGNWQAIRGAVGCAGPVTGRCNRLRRRL